MLRSGEWGYERLQLLARVRRADTLELLRRAGLRPGMRCLDPETVIGSPRTFQLWARRPEA